MDLGEMDYVRAALLNALYSDLDLEDVMECSIWAKTPEDFDTAVNLLGLTYLPVDVGEDVG